MKEKKYTADNIEVLDDRSHCRARPALYIGSTDSRGVFHLFYEIFANSVDEFLAGYCAKIIVTLNKDGSISIEDNGRGIPVDLHKQSKISAARLVASKLNAGGKFSHKNYDVSGGLHGQGMSCVNFLSSYFKLEVKRNEKLYTDEYKQGIPVVALKNGMLPSKKINSQETGTKITFLPDKEIFSDISFNPENIKKKLQESAFLNKGLEIVFINTKNDENIIYKEDEGIFGYIKEINKDEDCLTKPIYIEGEYGGIKAEIALQYITDYTEKSFSYCNNISTIEGGTHVTGMRSGLTKLINNYIQELNKGKNLDGKDIRQGLVSIVSIKHTNPQFEGQTKTKLGNLDAKNALDNIMVNYGPIYFDKNIDQVEIIIKNALKSASLRKNIDNLKNKVFSKERELQNNGKLASCLSKKAQDNELFIVEGDSAGGTAKMGRDRKYQAILPLRGKVLNVEKATEDKIFANQEITSIILTLGTGYGEDYDDSKIKYDKIIIATDADIDGFHIRSLLLTLFYRLMPDLINNGHVYKAIPPLYKISTKDDFIYVYSDAELQKYKTKLKSKIKSIQRFKGLGEMKAEQLWETTMNPDTRKIVPITLEDAKAAENMTKIYMGTKVELRKENIMNLATDSNIDIDY
jgi:DNA gyrase subunit B